jgi:hypothetical protein
MAMTTSETTAVFLHIGTMKSGTSYLQTILRRNDQALAEVGVLQMTRLLGAVGDIRGREGRTWRKDFTGQWPKMMRTIEAWPGHTAILSQEFLAASEPADVRRVVEGLGDRPVTVIITARDLLRIIPSQWQTSVRSNARMSFADFVDTVLAPPEATSTKRGSIFWRSHDLGSIAEMWAEVAGPENVVMVTVPPPGGPPDLLWRRFAAVVGLDPDAFDATPDANANVSLSYSTVEMLRDVNKHLGGTLDAIEHRRLVWGFLASKLLQNRASKEDSAERPRLSAKSHELVRERVDLMIAGVRKSGIRVMGDLEDLRVAPYAAPEDQDERSGPTHPVPATASWVIAKMLGRIANLERQLAAQRPPSASDHEAASEDEAAPDHDAAHDDDAAAYSDEAVPEHGVDEDLEEPPDAAGDGRNRKRQRAKRRRRREDQGR